MVWLPVGLMSCVKNALTKNPELEGIDGLVAESGEARWTLETAKDLSLPCRPYRRRLTLGLPVSKSRRRARFSRKLLAAMRNEFGGHELNK